MRSKVPFPVNNPRKHFGDRKVLMIAHAFPPIDGSGVQPSAKFAKCLSQFGWLPTVWTPDAVESSSDDPALREEQSLGAVACRRNTGSGILARRRSLRGSVNARTGEGLSAAASRFAKAFDWHWDAWQSATLPPDDCISWARRSVGRLTKQIRSEGIAVIYSAYGPASNHWLALELKRRTNLPWVADFRDWWTDDYCNRKPSSQRRAVHRRCEQEVLEAADVVLVVSEQQSRILAGHIRAIREKLIAINDAIDPFYYEGVGDAETKDDWRFDGLASEGQDVYSPMESTRQLASIFDRLADRATEAVEPVHESLAACPP